MKKSERKIYSLVEASELAGLDHSMVVAFIEREWICPLATDELDQEDLARIRLIAELREVFGANDEAIPLVLHLVDQLHHLRSQLRKLGG